MRAIGVLVAFSTVLSAWCGQPEYRKECEVWASVMTRLNDQNESQMCTKNEQCTGLECSGQSHYRGFYSIEQSFGFSYCFGIAIHPCHQPLDLHIYLDVGDDIHLQKNISNSSDIQVQGFHFDVGTLGKADGFIHVDFTQKNISGHRYAEIGMQFRVRVQGTIAIVGVWPKSLQKTLMPKTDIPVPTCEPRVVTPLHDPASCVPYIPSSVKAPTHAPKVRTSTLPPDYTGSSSTTTKHDPSSSKATYVPTVQKSCNPHEGYQCDDTMMCDVKRKVCICQSDYSFNGHICVTHHHTIHTPTPFIIPVPENTTIISVVGHTSKNWTPIIIGVSIGCVALVMSIIGAILLFKYRAHQARYASHQLLINNEGPDGDDDDADDDPIDISP